MATNGYIETTRKAVACPYCESAKIAKWGVTSEGNQRYRCSSKSCRRTFLDTGTLNGRRMDPELVGSAIRDYFTGKSYKQIAEGLKEEYDLKKEPSKATIYEWVRDYTTEAQKQMKGHKAKTSGHWVADELEIKVGTKKAFLWNVMDSGTRYLLASYLTPRHDLPAARAVMRKAAQAADKPPESIKTDRLRAYVRTIKEIFPEAEHIQSQGIKADINNNLSERVNGTFRDRLKTMRSLDSIKTGNHYLDGWVLTYNNFRGHEGLGNKTPASAAKLDPPFKEWADVVKAEAAPRRETPKARPVSKSKSKPKVQPPKAARRPLKELPAGEKVRTVKRRKPKVRMPKPVFPKARTSTKGRRKTPRPPWIRALPPRLQQRISRN